MMRPRAPTSGSWTGCSPARTTGSGGPATGWILPTSPRPTATTRTPSASTRGRTASTSIHCARCHDHKFDPIAQAEYYGLQAVFAGVDRANRVYDSDPAVAKARRELLGRKADIVAGRFDAAAERAAVEAWEKEAAA